QEMGIRRGVYTSSMSVHYRKRARYPAEEVVPLDSPSVYGLTKGFGELICQYFARWFDMNIIALRITGPRTRAEWLAERRTPRAYPDGRRLYVTDEEDLANAYLGAQRVGLVVARHDHVVELPDGTVPVHAGDRIVDVELVRHPFRLGRELAMLVELHRVDDLVFLGHLHPIRIDVHLAHVQGVDN